MIRMHYSLPQRPYIASRRFRQLPNQPYALDTLEASISGHLMIRTLHSLPKCPYIPDVFGISQINLTPARTHWRLPVAGT